MAESTRKLVAIVFTDIAGFTELSSRNEAAALALVAKQRELFKPKVEEFSGQWLKEMGDGLLLSFDSSLNALNCAVWLQHLARDVEGLKIRIGVHTGDIVIAGGDVLGDGVNVASRIEPLAPVGGVALSKKVQLDLVSHPEFTAVSMGLADLKGVNEPIEVYCLTSHGLPGPEAVMAGAAKGTMSSTAEPAPAQGGNQRLLILTASLVTVLGIFAWVWVNSKPDSLTPSPGPGPVAKKKDNPQPTANATTPPITPPDTIKTNTTPAKPDFSWLPSQPITLRVPVRTLAGHTDDIRSIAFGPNGKWLASGAKDNTVRLWDLATGETVHILMAHSDEVNSVAFNPKGTQIISGADDQLAILWSVANGKIIHKLEDHDGWLWGVAFGPYGKFALTATGEDDNDVPDNKVRIWNAETGKLELILKGHFKSIMSVAVDPTGALVSTGSSDDTVRLWRFDNGDSIKVLRKHTDTVWCVAFSPDGNWLASGSDDQTAILWNPETHEPVHTLSGHADGINWVAFSPDSQWLVTASEDTTAKIWHVESGRQVCSIEPDSDMFWSATFNHDGTQLATGGGDYKIRTWKLPKLITGGNPGGGR